MAFVSRSEWPAFLESRRLSQEVFARAVELRLIPVYNDGEDQLVWEDDFVATPESWHDIANPDMLPFNLADCSFGEKDGIWSQIRFRNGLVVTLPPNRLLKGIPAVGPAIRKLARIQVGPTSGYFDVEWPGGIRVAGAGQEAERITQEIGRRLSRVSADRASELTKSAYYMGSKYALSSFLVEAVAGVLPPGGVVVDLMCGAGAATRAFSLNWEVIAGDALHFCSYLAGSFGEQGGENTVLDALPMIQSLYKRNFDALANEAALLLAKEDELLHSPLGFDTGLADAYAEFVACTPRFPEGGCSGAWSPVGSVNQRRGTGREHEEPYCLMLAYFGNIYFGVRQAIELDSLRYALDKISCPVVKRTALAALIATASYIGTGYAAQFAQPIRIGSLTRRRLFSLLERRAIRVFPEFSARLAALSGLRTEGNFPVINFVGTWQETLEQVSNLSAGKPTLAYLDAPYTRDEYSRYYHVLETLVRYHYPDAIGSGRVPDRKTGQIFRSPFFTRSSGTIAPLLSNIIASSLQHAEYCAWSYSSKACASIPQVVKMVEDLGGVLMETFATAHRYNSQGRSIHRQLSTKRVDEYLLIFRRRCSNESILQPVSKVW